jgi:hypothetical protein
MATDLNRALSCVVAGVVHAALMRGIKSARTGECPSLRTGAIHSVDRAYARGWRTSFRPNHALSCVATGFVSSIISFAIARAVPEN